MADSLQPAGALAPSPTVADGSSGMMVVPSSRTLSGRELRLLRSQPKKYLEYLSEQNRIKAAALAARAHNERQQLVADDPVEAWKKDRENSWVQSVEPPPKPVASPQPYVPSHQSDDEDPWASSPQPQRARRGLGSSLMQERRGDEMKQALFPDHPDFADKPSSLDAAAQHAPSNGATAAGHIKIRHRQRSSWNATDATAASLPSVNSTAASAASHSAAFDALQEAAATVTGADIDPLQDVDADADGDADHDDDDSSAAHDSSAVPSTSTASSGVARSRKSWAAPSAFERAELKRLMDEQHRLSQLEEEINAREQLRLPHKTAQLEESKETDAATTPRQQSTSSSSTSSLPQVLPHFSSSLLSSRRSSLIDAAPIVAESADESEDVDGDAGRGRSIGNVTARHRRRKTWSKQAAVVISTVEGNQMLLSPVASSSTTAHLAATPADRDHQEHVKRVLDFAAATAAASPPSPLTSPNESPSPSPRGLPPSSLPTLPSLPSLPPLPPMPMVAALPALPTMPPATLVPSTFSPSGAQTSRRPDSAATTSSSSAVTTLFRADPSQMHVYDDDEDEDEPSDDWSDPLASERKRDVGDGDENPDKRYKLIFKDGDFGRYSSFYSSRAELELARQAMQRDIDAARRGGGSASVQPHTSRGHSTRPLQRWERPLWAKDLPVRGVQQEPAPTLPPSVPSTPRGAAESIVPPTPRFDPDASALPLDGFETSRTHRARPLQPPQRPPPSAPASAAPAPLAPPSPADDKCVIQ